MTRFLNFFRGKRMTLQWISIVIGVLAISGALVTLLRPVLVCRFLELFPRSVIPAWILMVLCCVLASREAMNMNMGAVDVIKPFIPFIALGVFAASVIFMRELLAPRALGGFLLLIAVPILQVTRWHESAWRLVVVVLVYCWIVVGIMMLMSPWYYRKIYTPFIKNPMLLRVSAVAKLGFGIGLVLLGVWVY